MNFNHPLLFFWSIDEHMKINFELFTQPIKNKFFKNDDENGTHLNNVNQNNDYNDNNINNNNNELEVVLGNNEPLG